MPIDPNIALSFKPAQAPDPMEGMQRLLMLKGLQQQQVSNQQTQQMGALQLQQQQQAMTDEAAGRNLFQQNAAPSDDEILRTMGPVRGAAVLKSRLETSKLRLEHDLKQNEFIGQSLAPARDEGSYQQTLAELRASGVDTSKMAPNYSPDVVQGYVAKGMSIKDRLSAEHDRTMAGIAELNAKTTAAGQVETGRHNQATEAAATSGQAETARHNVVTETQTGQGQQETSRHNLATEQSAAAGQAEAGRHNRVEEQQGAARIGVERQNAQRLQHQFDATYGALLGPNGEQLSPEAQKAMASQDPQAVAIANYQLPPMASRNGVGSPVMRKVMALNPTYNAQNWQSQSAMLKGYTSGAQSKELSGINTALGHVGVLGQAIDALNNSNVQILNRIGNAIGVQTGGDAVTTFRAIVHKVAPELNRAYVGGVGAQGEILAQESDFDPKLGDKQLRSNVAVTAKLLRSKIGSLEKQWKETMGSDFESRFLTPEAKETIERLNPQGAAGAGGQLPQGGGKAIDPGTAQKFYEAAGGDPNKARELATKNGWKIQ